MTDLFLFLYFFFLNFIREGTASEQHWLSDRILKNSKVCGEHWIELCFQINTEERWALICEISYLWACVAKRRSEAQSDDLHGNSLLIKSTWSHGEKHTHASHSCIYLYSYAHLFFLIETLKHILLWNNSFWEKLYQKLIGSGCFDAAGEGGRLHEKFFFFVIQQRSSSHSQLDATPMTTAPVYLAFIPHILVCWFFWASHHCL